MKALNVDPCCQWDISDATLKMCGKSGICFVSARVIMAELFTLAVDKPFAGVNMQTLPTAGFRLLYNQLFVYRSLHLHKNILGACFNKDFLDTRNLSLTVCDTELLSMCTLVHVNTYRT